MANYQEMYLAMARAVEQAIRLLIEAQQACEELYLSSEDDNLLRISDSGSYENSVKKSQKTGRR